KGADASLKSMYERHQAAAEVQEAVASAKVNWGDVDRKQFAELLGGTPSMTLEEKLDMTRSLDSLSKAEGKKLFKKLEKGVSDLEQRIGCRVTTQKVCLALQRGYMESIVDVEGAEAAAVALESPVLAVVALAHRFDKIGQGILLNKLKAALRARQDWHSW